MADNVLLNRPTVPGGQTVRTHDVGGGLELSIGAVTDITGTNAAAVVAASTPATGADTALVVAERSPSTGTPTSIDASISSVTLLAANSTRLGATVYNESTEVLYLLMGTPASTTQYNVQMPPDALYELPYGFTGIVTGVWASATGAARVVELT